MANLSELLNPAPQAKSQTPGSSDQALDARAVANQHTPSHQHNMRPSNIITGGSPRRPSITSPLDALAEVATSSAPLPSPSRPAQTSIPYEPHHYSLPTPSSRPTSSHKSPPKSFDRPRGAQHSHSVGQFSPGLEQYHHVSNGGAKARRLSDLANTSVDTLPPLRRSLPDENLPPPAALPIVEPHTENDIGASGNGFVSSIPTSPSFEPVRPIPEPLSPVTTQIRQPSPGPPQHSHSLDVPAKQGEQIQVKTEMTEVPPELSGGPPDQATMAGESTTALEPPNSKREVSATANGESSMGDDASASVQPPADTAETPTPKPPAKPKSAPTKKRAAPKKGTASTAKGSNKKRKIDNESVVSSPALPRTGTPASSRASKTPAPKGGKQGSVTPAPKGGKQGSVTPARSSSVLNANEDDQDDEMDEGDSSELFCICRKPDDHTWMIACDGPCEDWFHGKCINMNEHDGKLIEKYFCPNCTSKNVGQTLWKPMCRLPTCRLPARTSSAQKSKYCSDDHGAEFMRLKALQGLPDEHEPPKKAFVPPSKRRSRKDNYTDNLGNGSDPLIYEDQEEGDDESYLRGGLLRPAELKTLASNAKDITDFRNLGDAVLSPPETVSGEDSASNLTPAETAQLEEITTKIESVKRQKQMLDDREKLLEMMKARAKAALEELKKKEKKKADLCGFDPRLTWQDEEFLTWRNSSEGAASLRTGTLVEPPDTAMEVDHSPAKTEGLTNGVKESGSSEMEDGDEAGKEVEVEGGMCTKKRCKRHEMWQKLLAQEAAFEREQLRQEMKRLVGEEKEVRERAALRGLEA